MSKIGEAVKKTLADFPPKKPLFFRPWRNKKAHRRAVQKKPPFPAPQEQKKQKKHRGKLPRKKPI